MKSRTIAASIAALAFAAAPVTAFAATQSHPATHTRGDRSPDSSRHDVTTTRDRTPDPRSIDIRDR